MQYKKIISILITSVMALSSVALNTFAAEEEVVSVNNTTREVTISGESIQFPGTVVTINVWYPGKSAESLKKGATLDEASAYIAETVVDEENKYTLSFELKESDPSGMYTVNVYIPGETKPATYEAKFNYTVRANFVFEQAVSGTAQEIEDALDSNSVDVDVENGNKYQQFPDDGDDREYVATYICNNRPATLEDLIEKLETVVKKIEVTRSLKGIEREKIISTLKNEKALLLISDDDLNKYDNVLNDVKKEYVVVQMNKALRNCNYPEDVAAAFKKAVEDAQNYKEDTDDSTPSNVQTKKPVASTSPTFSQAGLENVNKPIDALTPFTDLDSVDWARNAVIALYDREIINGKSAKEFYPNDYIKREEIAKILVNAFSIKSNIDSAPTFKDVVYGQWYYNSVQTITSLSIAKGYSTETFGIGDSVTRQDLAVLILNSLKNKGYSLSKVKEMVEFNDSSEISEYAQGAVETLYTTGVINGVGNNNFAPKKYATRAEAAKMIYEVMYKLNLI